MNRHMSYPERNALAVFRTVESSISEVPCTIWGMESSERRLRILLEPNRAQAEFILDNHRGRLASEFELGWKKDAPTVKIEAEVEVKDSTLVYQGKDLGMWKILLSYSDLRVEQVLGGGKEAQGCVVDYFINPNRLLGPFGEINLGGGSTVTLPPHRERSIELCGHTMRFKRVLLPGVNSQKLEYRFHAALVGQLRLGKTPSEAEVEANEILLRLDDTLLLLSFAAREKCSCQGWRLSSGPGFTSLYRGDSEPLTDIAGENHPMPLIESDQVESFLKTTMIGFQSFNHQDSIRNALRAVLRMRAGEVKSGFLLGFSALEELLSAFKKQEKLKSELPSADFKKLKEELEVCIRASPVAAGIPDSAPKKMILSKLSDLNRVSLSSVFEKFVEHFDVPVSGIWPAFESSTHWSLYKIRNKLVHGGFHAPDRLPALETALWHLYVLLERSLLCVLGWDQETYVWPSVKPTSEEEIERATKEFSRVFDV